MRFSLLPGLSDPNRAFLVLLIGLVLVYRECITPGRVFPGIAGGVFAISASYALFQHPWSVMGAILLLLGIGLITAQAFGTWYWLPGIAGTICLVIGAIKIVVVPPIRPAYAALSIPFGAVTIALARTAVRARRNKRSVQ